MEAVKKGKKADYELLLARLLHSCRDMTYEAFSNTILNAAEKIIRIRRETAAVNGEFPKQRDKLKEQFEKLSSRQELLGWLLSLFDAACHSTAAQMEEATALYRCRYKLYTEGKNTNERL